MDNKMETTETSIKELPPSPFAKYQGILKLGDTNIDCYVSDTKKRLISMRATVKAIADVDSGKAGQLYKHKCP